MKKRLTALLLVISMMFGLLSVGAAGAGYAFTDDDGTGTWTWASDYIYDCYEEGIINGYEDGTYLPDNSLTRAEAAKIIAVTFGLESDTAASTFSDVSADHWALPYIEACVEAGIINGYEDGTFLPGNNVTRAEMAKMIAAALELTADAEESSFNDTASHWAMTYIEACVDAGIVNGYEDGTFLPGNSISRAEAATIISRTLDYIDAEKEADQLLEEFKAKDTEDFEDCEIINFDEDETTNFAVLAEDAAVVTSSGSENVLASADEDSGVYVIENASDEVIALQTGDVLYYVYGDGTEDYLLIKIAELTLSDGAVTLVAETEDVDLSDFFCYIDVDMELEVTEDNFTPAESDSVTYLGAASEAEESAALLASASTSPLPSAALLSAAETTLSDTFSFEISHTFSNGYKVMGTLNQKFSVNLKVEYDLALFGEDYSAFSLSLGSKSTVTAAFVSSGIDSDDDCELLLGGISIPVGGTPLLIEAQVYAALDLSLKTSVVLTAEYEAETGISYDSEDGFDLIGESDGEISLKSEVSGSVFVGLKLDIGLDGLKVFDIGVEGKAGLNVKGTSDVLGISTDGDINHLCTLCIDGEVNLAASAKGTFKILDNPVAASDEIEVSRKLCDFYVSLYESNELEFGTGTCPHKEYLVTVTALDSSGDPIADAAVYLDADLLDETTDEDGQITFWCGDGSYTVSVTKDGYSAASFLFVIDGEAASVTLTLTSNIYLAYYNKLMELQDEYGVGELKSGNSGYSTYLTGLCFAQLVDFDNDGQEELLLAYQSELYYHGSEITYMEYLIEVWTYSGGSIKKLYSSNGFQEQTGRSLVLTKVSGKYYLIEGMVDSFDYNYIYGMEDGAFAMVRSVCVDDYYADDPAYSIDGTSVSSSVYTAEYNKWWKNSTVYNLNYGDSAPLTVLNSTIATLEDYLGYLE